MKNNFYLISAKERWQHITKCGYKKSAYGASCVTVYTGRTERLVLVSTHYSVHSFACSASDGLVES